MTFIVHIVSPHELHGIPPSLMDFHGSVLSKFSEVIREQLQRWDPNEVVSEILQVTTIFRGKDILGKCMICGLLKKPKKGGVNMNVTPSTIYMWIAKPPLGLKDIRNSAIKA